MIYTATSSALFKTLKTYQYKKDIPAHLRIGVKRINFGLMGLYYVPWSYSGLLCEDNTTMPYHEVYLIGFGPVIGPRDLEAASHRDFANEWRASYAAAIQARIDLYATNRDPQL